MKSWILVAAALLLGGCAPSLHEHCAAVCAAQGTTLAHSDGLRMSCHCHPRPEANR